MLWIKAFHVISIISWMAGIFYLPRLFAYHAGEVEKNSPTDMLFQKMEKRLLQIIMTPAMILSWAFGLILFFHTSLDWSMLWVWAKLFSVLAMTWFHFWLVGQRKIFLGDTPPKTSVFYRRMNEIPTILMIIIIFSVIARPF